MTKDQKRASTLVSVVAIVAIGILEAIALLKGIDGTYFGLAMAGIAGAAGFTLRGFLK